MLVGQGGIVRGVCGAGKEGAIAYCHYCHWNERRHQLEWIEKKRQRKSAVTSFRRRIRGQRVGSAFSWCSFISNIVDGNTSWLLDAFEEQNSQRRDIFW